ncbi:type III secretion system chaperone family protein [Pseudonocardia phyllosphaerae]|uniref:YbjN domain-containing protein n=1 Tax=Pseudonocardia phyllosphaerae TaxID=3390502 RepID=UPI003978D835
MSEPLDTVVGDALAEAEVEHVHRGDGQWLVTLPGEARLQTQTWLIVREQTLAVQAFVCRRPDENFEGVYRFMLLRNAKLYGVHYCLDRVGDIHLVGRIPRHAVTAAEIDRVLGSVLAAADGDFNTFLELGFASSIRREYAWRTDNGESTANLKAFEHLLD